MGHRVVEVDSVHSYLQFVKETLAGWRCSYPTENPEPWYRGDLRSSFDLVPGALRSACDETSMFHRFCAQAPLLMPLEHRPSSEWEWYFAAQHYGLPTRLLDWSEDPLVALYFAIRANQPDSGIAPEYREGDPPCAWMMEAGSLNFLSQGNDCVYIPEDTGKLTGEYLPRRECQKELRPIAIHPVQMTNRIVAQLGKFTVHGADETPLNKFWNQKHDGGRENELVQIRLTKPDAMSMDLFDLGYTKLRLFPEAANLSDHLKRVNAIK